MRTRLLIAVLAMAGSMVAANQAAAQDFSVYANGQLISGAPPPVELLDVHVGGGVGSWGTTSVRAARGVLHGYSYAENPISGLYTPQVQTGGWSEFEAYDITLTGPSATVPVIFHFVFEGRLQISGSYPYGASGRFIGLVPGGSDWFEGWVALDGNGLQGTGMMSGVTGSVFSAPIDLSGYLTTDSPDFMYVLVETGAGGTALGLDVNTATADFMNDIDGDGVGGFHLPTVDPAVTVPDGYTVNSVSLGIVDNHWTGGGTTASVGEQPPAPSSWGRLKSLYR